MQFLAVGQFLALLLLAFLLALACLWAIGKLPAGTRHKSQPLMAPGDTNVALLFHDDLLVDMSDGARALLPTSDEPPNLSDIVMMLEPRFPELGAELANLSDGMAKELLAEDGVGALRLSWSSGVTRLEVLDEPPAQAVQNPFSQGPANFDVTALENELATLRGVTENAPLPVWRLDPYERITWANRAYLDLAAQLNPNGEAGVWPPSSLFDGKLPDIATETGPTRIALPIPGHIDPAWFEVSQSPLGADRLCCAVPIDSQVRAEDTLSRFVQSLTQTFAHLTVGLAIFDKQRKLTLFNPALGDLTGLKAEFLSARPSLQAFLGKLRDKRMIPEPRDHKSWRQKVAELEHLSKDGTFEESWPLPDGQTFVVKGHPHPDGAIALLFEDKSAELSVMRRYHAEQEISQGVIDALDDAIVVFAPSGLMVLANRACSDLWQIDESAVNSLSILDATRAWSELCAPSPLWGDLRDYVRAFGERAEWTGDLRLADGRGLLCRATPLAGGTTLVCFAEVTPKQLTYQTDTDREEQNDLLAHPPQAAHGMNGA